MKIRKILKMKQVAICFDCFNWEDCECFVIKNGNEITLYGQDEFDNGLYMETPTYSRKVTLGELRKALKNYENVLLNLKTGQEKVYLFIHSLESVNFVINRLISLLKILKTIWMGTSRMFDKSLC